MEIIKHITNKGDDLIFIGYHSGEEIYQETNKSGGWSLMGLRPNTEDELRERQREADPSDFFDLPDWAANYFNYEEFANDMEDNWYEHHDVQAERENEDGETLYLGFGLGTSIDHYFQENNITDYKSYCDHFEYIGLTEAEFWDVWQKHSSYANVKELK